MRSHIVGTGHYLPPRIVTNEELESTLNTTSRWIIERTGIKERRFIDPGMTNSLMATEATRAALLDAGYQAQAIDAIIVATLSPDVAFPGTSVFLQRELGLHNIPAIDVRAQCSGFVYALSIAHAWIVAGIYERVLIVGSEIHSTGLDMREDSRHISVLFGDGAGAVIMERAAPESPGGLVDITLGADGRGAELLMCEGQSSGRYPNISHQDLDEGRQYPRMEGRMVFRKAVEKLDQEIRNMITKHNLHDRLDEIVLIPHQSNKLINDMVAKRLGFKPENVIHTIEYTANTTAASIPIAFDIARKNSRIKPGTPIIFAAFGSGLTWGTALYFA